MSNYRRTTRECTLDQLRPELAEAIRAHAQRQQWNDWEVEITTCCETTAERISANRLDAWLNRRAAPITYLALIATPRRLIWAFSNDRIGAASAQYQQMHLKISRSKNSQDIAVEIFAHMEGTREKAGGRLMLGSNPAAEKFCEEVRNATSQLRPSSAEQPRRKWFGLW